MSRLCSPKTAEIVRYLFWGGMTTAVSWISYAAFVWLWQWFSPETAVAGGNVLSWIAAVIFAFFVNKFRVFRSKGRSANAMGTEMLKFLASRLTTGVLEMVGVPLLVAAGLHATLFGVEGMVAKVIVSVLVVILNYIFGKWFVFRK